MPRPLRIQYPNAPPASPERLAMTGRVVLRYEQGEKGCDKAESLKGYKAFISKETPEGINRTRVHMSQGSP